MYNIHAYVKKKKIYFSWKIQLFNVSEGFFFSFCGEHWAEWDGGVN
jgi:hypothetical protein